jgi:hypothetical protein
LEGGGGTAMKKAKIFITSTNEERLKLEDPYLSSRHPRSGKEGSS